MGCVFPKRVLHLAVDVGFVTGHLQQWRALHNQQKMYGGSELPNSLCGLRKTGKTFYMGNKGGSKCALGGKLENERGFGAERPLKRGTMPSVSHDISPCIRQCSFQIFIFRSVRGDSLSPTKSAQPNTPTKAFPTKTHRLFQLRCAHRSAPVLPASA